MNREEFMAWWFDHGGEEESFEKYGDQITEDDIHRQPSWQLLRNRENAITEAVWEKAYAEKVETQQ